MRRILLLLAGLLATYGSVHADEIRKLSDTRAPFSFVVLGDLHYKGPDYKMSAVVHEIGRDMADTLPPVAFMCQTGDIVEGGGYSMKDGRRQFTGAGHEAMNSDLAYATKDLTDSFGVPVFIAVGNHDKHGGNKAYGEVVLPVLSRELGASLSRNFYAFRWVNSCFVFLDSGLPAFDEQAAFIEDVLAQAKNASDIKHMFLFGHHPLWTVIRPGFFSPGYTASLMPILRKWSVDAYFCGHTHNTIAQVRNFDGCAITQIQGVACTADTAPQPMEQRRTLLVPAAELPYSWGYSGGPAAGNYLVTVDGARVNVKLRTGAKVLRELEWQEPCKLRDVIAPEPPPTVPVTEEILRQATAATLCLCPWAEERTEVDIAINGEPVTKAEIGPTYKGNAFWDEKRIPIPKEKLSALRLINEIQIENPTKAIFGVGSVRLEAALPDRSVARTGVSQAFYFSSGEADAIAAGKTAGWKAILPQMARPVELGQPLRPIELKFPAKE